MFNLKGRMKAKKGEIKFTENELDGDGRLPLQFRKHRRHFTLAEDNGVPGRGMFKGVFGWRRRLARLIP